MVTMQDLVTKILALPPKDMELLGESLAWYSPAQAERLKNAITVAQQEMDALENREREFEMLQYADDAATADAQCYGER